MRTSREGVIILAHMRRRLKLAIAGAGWTQVRLANHLGMHPNRLSAIVQGWRDPTSAERVEIAAALGRSARGLFTVERADRATA
jgi:plasmid maintenance system antidote protein VapI